MAVVFSQDLLGYAVGVPVQYATPINKIKLNIEDMSDTYSISGLGASAYDRAKQEIVLAAENYLISLVNEYGPDVLTTAAETANVALRAAGAEPISEQFIAQLANWQGIQKIPLRVTYNGALGGYGAFFKARSRVPLTQIIKPLGLMTGISLDMQEPVNKLGVRVEAGAQQQMYQGSISGVIFEGSCDAKKCTTNDSPETICADKNYHGIEALLEYFYHHRVTNALKDLTFTTLSIGQSVIKGWVVGLSVDPLNLDYRIWKWSIHLLLAPDFFINPPMAPSTDFRFLPRKFTPLPL